jgi:hypothetical protein
VRGTGHRLYDSIYLIYPEQINSLRMVVTTGYEAAGLQDRKMGHDDGRCAVSMKQKCVRMR